jgi:DNA-binding HxlR family transcriptional regulator/putative sterol carrier protein
MPGQKRSYGQFCAVARALDLVGERWTLLLVRELLLGPQRFKDLLDGLPGIGTNLLAARLKDLEQAGILARGVLPPPAGSAVYELTELGAELAPVVFALGRFGARLLGEPRPGEAVRPGWFMVSLPATFHPKAAKGLRATYEVRLDGEPFEVGIADGAATVRQGPAARPDATLDTDLETLIGLLSGAADPRQALASGAIETSGGVAFLRRFISLFCWAPDGDPPARS